MRKSKMTSLLALAMSAILVLSQAGCGSGGKDTGESTAPAAPEHRLRWHRRLKSRRKREIPLENTKNR